ncbi:protein RETICULATA-RELATED 4, chloroplastic-like isoform X2 [Primulina huaijiensis]|uniref:protein RETICULATA-RELATED 4, chloroplastic-like isoform X2 n=1 Tax=Primulina huaijiensis TaxID=1492673 RepID=UPI003CC6E8D5
MSISAAITSFPSPPRSLYVPHHDRPNSNCCFSPPPASLNLKTSSFLSLSSTPTPRRPLYSSFSINAAATDSEINTNLFSGDGNGGIGGIGGGGGGEDSNSGNEGNDDKNKNKNREEALMVLAEAGRNLQSLPKDLKAAIEDGRIPGSIVSRYFDLEKSGFISWLMKFGGFKERLLADDLFLAKVGIECGVGLFTKVMAIIADFMLVYLPAPTVSLRPPLALNAGRLARFFYSCPDNAFQVALSGTSFSLLQRVGATARNGAKLFAVGATSSLVGTVVTNAFINARKAVEHSAEDEVENVPVISTSVGYGIYMAISSNLRYQMVAGVIEQRILDPMLHQHKLLLSALCFAVRTGNTFLGSLLWVDYARLIGIQKAQ